MSQKKYILGVPCVCGCGEIAWQGNRFVHGHNGRVRVLTPPAERFWPKVRVGKTPQDCWVWIGARHFKGYGSFCGKAHRFSYELFKGPIPAGLTIDHLCRNTYCVNPEHLEAVTNRENILRGISPPAIFAKKTHCSKGHEFTPENTYIRNYKIGRKCRICMSERSRRVAGEAGNRCQDQQSAI